MRKWICEDIIMTDQKKLTEAEWRAKLTPDQYHVLREAGTERAFTGQYDKHFEQGTYCCAGCGELLFESDAKYNSGCGWPAFTRPAQGEAVEERRDISHGMVRSEEHTSELQSLMRIPYAVFCFKKKKQKKT